MIHHLAISNNVPLGALASFFASLSLILIVEFVPKSDPQAQRLLVSRKDIFSSYDQKSFEREFARYYKGRESTRIGDAGRQVYLMERC